MTTPERPSNADAWSAYLGSHLPNGAPLPHDRLGPKFCPAPNLAVDPQCPRCGRADHWRLLQVLGETPGIPEMAAQGNGLVYRCGLCAFTRRYRERPATDRERAERTATLLRGAGR